MEDIIVGIFHFTNLANTLLYNIIPAEENAVYWYCAMFMSIFDTYSTYFGVIRYLKLLTKKDRCAFVNEDV